MLPAISLSASQNSSSKVTLVRCPRRVSDLFRARANSAASPLSGNRDHAAHAKAAAVHSGYDFERRPAGS